MEENAEEDTIQRKVINRKRSAEKGGRTPKRARVGRGGRGVPNSGQNEWIENSFINKKKCEFPRGPGSPQSPKLQSGKNLTSTPVSKKSTAKQKNEENQDPFYNSFNESDSVFANMDLDTHIPCGTPLRRSSRKAKSVYRHNSPVIRPTDGPKSQIQATQKITQGLKLYSEDVSQLLENKSYVCESDDSLFGDMVPDSELEQITSATPMKIGTQNVPVSGIRSTALVSTQYETDMEVFTQGDPKMVSQVKPGHYSNHLAKSSTSTPTRRALGDLQNASQYGIETEEDGMGLTQRVPTQSKIQTYCVGEEICEDETNKEKLKDDTASNTAVASMAVTPKPGQSDQGAGQLGETNKLSVRSKTPRSRLAQLKAQNLEKVLMEVEEERAASKIEFDVGPFYGLPSKVPEILARERRITSLYKWQDECLSLDAVKERKNLIYSLPTSGGKTLVAEILMFRELLCQKKDAILILPFVAIVQEKVKTLSPFALELDFVVEEYAASKGHIPPRKKQRKKTIFIATIEKASSLINSFIEIQRISEVGLVVVDELHMLGEGGGRGAILETTLAKLMHSSSETHIIGMSATLSNISDLSLFLNADIYTNDFRPVELTEYVKVDDTIFEVNKKSIVPADRLLYSRILTFPYDNEKKKADPDYLAGLVQEVIPQHSCLVFCPTKKNCENVAELLCRNFPRDLIQVKKVDKRILLQSLWREGNGQICPVLRRTVHYGVAYHHSGLTMDERKLIEEAYLGGVLCLLTCTSTLAAGVNLPAKRVILRAPYVAMDFLSRSQYKQMVGRAGRAGLDSSGESILVVPKKDKTKVLDLVSGPCDFCSSSLLYEKNKGVRALLLSTIGLKITPTLQSVADFLQKTLCYNQREHLGVDILTVAQQALQQLLDMDLIEQTVESYSTQGEHVSQAYCLEVTRLGRAVFKGSVDIDRGPQLYADLRQAQESLVVANYLHLLYLATPYDMVSSVRPDWMTYLDQISCMEGDELKVLSLIGVPESYIAKRAAGQRYNKSVNEFVVNRFYITIILYNLWKQRSIWDVSQRFQVPRGLIQNILNGAATFAVCTGYFCQELEEFWAYQDLFTNFTKKLSFCFMMDLIPLLEIPGVRVGRARQLFNAGFKNLQQVAHAEPQALVDAVEHMPKKVANDIITAAKVLLSEKVEALEDEAQQMKTAPTDSTEKEATTGEEIEPAPKFDTQESSAPNSVPT